MWNNIENMILYEDKEIIVCHKAAGIAVQSARIGIPDMESTLKNYLASKNPGTMPYLGIVHIRKRYEGVSCRNRSETGECAGTSGGLSEERRKNKYVCSSYIKNR